MEDSGHIAYRKPLYSILSIPDYSSFLLRSSLYTLFSPVAFYAVPRSALQLDFARYPRCISAFHHHAFQLSSVCCSLMFVSVHPPSVTSPSSPLRLITSWLWMRGVLTKSSTLVTVGVDPQPQADLHVYMRALENSTHWKTLLRFFS